MKIKNVFKKVTIAALLATPVIGNMTATSVHAASWVAGATNIDGSGGDYPNDDDWDSYDAGGVCSWRNFKGRNLNVYVKDKSLLSATKKAIKMWKPVFNIKLVKSAKHANYHSTKYANLIIYDNKARTPKQHYDVTSTRVYEYKDPVVIKWAHGDKYTAYANPHFTRKNIKLLKKDPNLAITDAFAPKDWKKKAFTNHMNGFIGTKGTTQQEKVNMVAFELGTAMGLGMDNLDPNEIMNYDNYKGNKKLSQADIDHVDWIYSHPYTGRNSVYERSEAHGL